MDDDSEEMPVLSGAALDALKEFYADRDARQKQFEDLKSAAEDDAGTKPVLTMDAFAENWNESQFWYSQETATVLANQLLAGSSKETVIAVISAPSAFVQLKNIIASSDRLEEEKPKIFLLEFDKRFEVFDEFVFYDFHSPFKLPPSLKGAVDHIICDPPFLSEDCQTKGKLTVNGTQFLELKQEINNIQAAMTVRWLSKSWGESVGGKASDTNTRLIVCTGERMQTLVNKLYRPQGIATTTFEPVHAKGLSNEFYCYANFECENWRWRH